MSVVNSEVTFSADARRPRIASRRAAEENQRLARELDAMRAPGVERDVTTELSTLKEERDVIRTRVGEMLEQLEALNL